MRILGALILTFGLAACGGGGKPAATDPADNAATDPVDDPAPTDGELCCCDYIEESGDGDMMSENQAYNMMPPEDCEGMGQCTDDGMCSAE